EPGDLPHDSPESRPKVSRTHLGEVGRLGHRRGAANAMERLSFGLGEKTHRVREKLLELGDPRRMQGHPFHPCQAGVHGCQIEFGTSALVRLLWAALDEVLVGLECPWAERLACGSFEKVILDDPQEFVLDVLRTVPAARAQSCGPTWDLLEEPSELVAERVAV
ncbi:MAG: hypothetical protein ACE5F1_07670, partial [Planctomycetota bacterium]